MTELFFPVLKAYKDLSEHYHLDDEAIDVKGSLSADQVAVELFWCIYTKKTDGDHSENDHVVGRGNFINVFEEEHAQVVELELS